MKHNIVSSKKFILLVAVMAMVGSVFGGVESVDAASGCFIRMSETNQVVKLDSCDYQSLKNIGFKMGNLPNPLESATKCYSWGTDAKVEGQEVNCDLNEYANAKSMSQVSQENAAAQAKNNTNNSTAKNNQDADDPDFDTTTVYTDAERKAIVNCGDPSCLKDNPLVKYTKMTMNFLSVGVGVVVTIMIIVGGIQYASAGQNPQSVQAAKGKITNAIIALVAYFFLYAFIQYLIPGGAF